MRKPRAAGDAWSAISRQRSTIQEPLADEDRLAVRRGLGHDDAERVGEERRAPELDPPSLPVTRSSPFRGPLVAHAVHRRDVASVRDRVAALDRPPGVELGGAVARLLLR